MNLQNVLTAEDLERVETALRIFRQSAKVRAVFLVDLNGQLLGQAGDATRLDSTAMAALTAGNHAASRGIAELLGEPGFGGVFHEGTQTHLYVCTVGPSAVLVVVFDAQTSIGLVRLRSRKATEHLSSLFAEAESRRKTEPAQPSPFAEITEEDIDQLFR